VQSAYTSAIQRSLFNWNGRDCNGSLHYILCNWVLLLSCDYILKFDWYCQLSGSGSNRLNSRKLPGCFSYGLGMRLGYSWILQWIPIVSTSLYYGLSQLTHASATISSCLVQCCSISWILIIMGSW